jgi:hypothetical protein
VVLAALAPPTLLAGAVVGGVLGGLHPNGLGVDSTQRDHLAAALADGEAAVGVPVAEDDLGSESRLLTELGGEQHVLTLTEEAIAEIDAAAPAVEAAEAAQGEASAPPAS